MTAPALRVPVAAIAALLPIARCSFGTAPSLVEPDGSLTGFLQECGDRLPENLTTIMSSDAEACRACPPAMQWRMR